MKQLSDFDIKKMADEEFAPNEREVKNEVRHQLRLSEHVGAHICTQNDRAQICAPTTQPCIDLHNHTIEQAWGRVVELLESGARRAIVITGASGVLKTEFQKWMTESILSPNIISCEPLNNGSFEIRIRKKI